jgi:hypothetical protein
MDERPRSSAATQARVAAGIGLRTVDSGGGRVAIEKQDANSQLLKDHYLNVRDLILGKLGEEDPALLDAVDDFFINFSMETAEFTNADGDRVVIDLMTLTDEDMQGYVEAYLKLADETLSTRKHRPFTVSAQSKGNASKGAPRSFRRGTTALDALPKTFQAASQTLLPQLLQGIEDSAKRRVVVKRVMRAEFIQRRALQSIGAKITEVDTAHRAALLRQTTDPAARRVANKLGKQLVELRALQKEIREVDAAGLAIGLAHFPTDNYIYQDTREAAALKARDFTESLLKVEDENDKPAERAFTKDVGGLMHQRRWQYKAYAHEQGIAFKQESFADVLFRSVIDFENKEMAGDSLFYKPVYLYNNDFVTPAVRDDVKPMMASTQRRMAIDLTPHFAPDAFNDIQGYPPGASDKGKAAVDQANMELINAEISRLRKATRFEAPAPAAGDEDDDVLLGSI